MTWVGLIAFYDTLAFEFLYGHDFEVGHKGIPE